MAFGSSRWVIPKTIEAKVAKIKAAVKWERRNGNIYFFFPIAMWWASTALMMFNSPATAIKIVP